MERKCLNRNGMSRKSEMSCYCRHRKCQLMKPKRSVSISFLLLPVLLAFTKFSSGQETMRYGFKQDKTVSYDVKITAVIGDVREIREGTSTLTAQEITDQQIRMQATGNLNVRRQGRDGSPVFVMPDFRMGPPVNDFLQIRPSSFSIDPYGRLIEIEVQTALPFMLGDYEQLLLDELPRSRMDTKWSQQREVSIIRQTRNSPFPKMMRPSGFGPPGFGPRGFGPPGFGNDDLPRDQRSASERISWEIVSRENGGIQVHKTYQLKTDDKVAGKPRRSMEGEGDQTFDPAMGLWRSGLMQYEIFINDENASVQIPVTVSFRLLSESEAAKREKDALESKAKAEMALEKAKEANRPKPVSDEERRQLLLDLATGDPRIMQKAGERLSKVPTPVKADAEISEALARASVVLDGFPRSAVAKALAVWATPEQEKILIQLLSTNDFMVKPSAIQGLAKCPSATTAKVLALQMKDISSRTEAAKSLRQLGAPFAEEPLLELLNDRDLFTRNEVTRILQEIGTSKALKPLQELEKSGLPFAEKTAGDAIRAIQLRETAK